MSAPVSHTYLAQLRAHEADAARRCDWDAYHALRTERRRVQRALGLKVL